jgi:hypothetical protein
MEAAMSYSVAGKFLVASMLALLLLGCATDPYEAVKLGDTRQHVVELLGRPNDPQKDFTHGEREVLQGTLDTMNTNGAASLSVWKRPGELFYVVGFNGKGGVTVKRRFFYVAP